jgi:hypothetical protein
MTAVQERSSAVTTPTVEAIREVPTEREVWIVTIVTETGAATIATETEIEVEAKIGTISRMVVTIRGFDQIPQ